MSVIHIRNKLEIRPGNVISVPGCEPTSSLTSLGLLKNFNCKSSIIPVKDVLRLIPGARIVRVTTPIGQNGTGSWIELPAGPPPIGQDCPKCCIEDYYKILRDNAHGPEEEEANPLGPCSGFHYGCPRPQDSDYVQPLRRAFDPDLRPNGNPL